MTNEPTPSDRWALILGSSSGFGAACSEALAHAGFNIIGVHLDRKANLPKVQEVIERCRAAGVQVHFYNKNVADDKNRLEIIVQIAAHLGGRPVGLSESAIQDKLPSDIFTRLKEKQAGRELTLLDILSGDIRLSSEIVARLSQLVLPQLASAVRDTPARLYAMLHSVAFGALNPFISEDAKLQVSRAQIEMTIDIMANSLLYWVQDLVRAELLARGAKVFSMTSAGSHRVIAGYGPVSAAKAVLESHTRQLALELAPRGILVNCFEAGVTDTPAMRMIPNSAKIIEEVIARNPGGRLTTPQDIANTFVALMDPAVKWISGTVIKIDCGEDNI